MSFNATPLNEEEYVANIDEKIKELAEQQQTINSILAREQSIGWVATHLRELLIERARNIRGRQGETALFMPTHLLLFCRSDSFRHREGRIECEKLKYKELFPIPSVQKGEQSDGVAISVGDCYAVNTHNVEWVLGES